MTSPESVLGIAWGEDVNEMATRLGLTCDDWVSWGGGAEFATCLAQTPVRLFDQEAWPRLVRRGQQLAGIQFHFHICDDAIWTLRESIRTAFGLDQSDDRDLYAGLGDGGLVRFACDDTGVCTLTVAGPDFGRVYAARELARGFGELGASFPP